MIIKMELKHLLILLIISPLVSVVADTVLSAQGDPQDYKDLVHFAGIASIAYCIKHGLQPGELEEEDTNCPQERCQAEEFRDIEVVQIFDYNERGGVGSGFYGLDHKRKEVLLVYRGSASSRDWFSNVDAMPVKYDPSLNLDLKFDDFECEGCLVHRGFYLFIRNNSSIVFKKVNELCNEYSDYQLVVVGHSLGGALAILGGLELNLMGQKALVISFGGPRIGNHKLMDFIDETFDTPGLESNIEKHKSLQPGLVRVTHQNDFVPYLPPPSMLFSHAGYEYYINQRDTPHTNRVIERKGSDFSANTINVKVPSPGKLWPESFGKYEHTHYFIHITDCG